MKVTDGDCGSGKMGGRLALCKALFKDSRVAKFLLPLQSPGAHCSHSDTISPRKLEGAPW